MRIETWKPIIGYEGLYEVSNHGKVRRLHKQGTYKILIPSFKGKYLKVALSKNNLEKHISVARLVAKSFIPNDNPLERLYVKYKDGNKFNNHASNLEWYSVTEGILKVRYKGIGEKHPSAKLKEFQVVEIREWHKSGNVLIISLAEIYGVSKSCISDIVNRKKWRHLK